MILTFCECSFLMDGVHKPTQVAVGNLIGYSL